MHIVMGVERRSDVLHLQNREAGLQADWLTSQFDRKPTPLDTKLKKRYIQCKFDFASDTRKHAPAFALNPLRE